ncbi:MAG: ribonuclease HI [Firmicutes bacterium]|nr:ribonuclease HI [Bacillota bacterium]
MKKLVNIYTDGACAGNQSEENLGGWGCILEFAGIEKELCGGEDNTTNNRMELKALLSALTALKEEGLSLRIFSDSAYLVNCFRNGWYLSWEKNGWKNTKKQPVENQDLWKELLALLSKHEFEVFLIKGHLKIPTEKNYEQFRKHNGDRFSFADFAKISEYNNRCDALANEYIKEHRK